LRYLRLASDIFWLFRTVAIYIAWRATSAIIIVDCSFLEQRSVNTACMELRHLWEIAFSPWLEVGRWASNVGGKVGFP